MCLILCRSKHDGRRSFLPSPARGEGASSALDAQDSAVPTKARANASQTRSAAPQARAASAPVASGAESFAANETKTVTFDGVQYEITNRNSTASDISFSKDENGQVTFWGSYFTIKAQKDVAHDILINGNYLNFYGGNLDDKIETTSGTFNNNIYGGAGDDTIISNSTNSRVSGEAGNDTITINCNSCYIYGGDGDDTINLNTGYFNDLKGDAGNDTFNITKSVNGQSSFIFGNDGDDVFNIIGNINGIKIDGGEGTNTFTGSITGNTLVNVVGGNAGKMSFAANQTQDILINNINYTVTNGAIAQDLIYKINDDGSIDFSTSLSKAITIKGDENKSHKVTFNSMYMTFYGGNIGNTISLSANSTVYTGNGINTVSCSSGNNRKLG